MFRLAHLSDVHLGPLPPLTLRQLASKRITGYVNWRTNRKHGHHSHIIDRVTAHMMAAQPSHIAVTGDLVNLALDIEIENARLWLEVLGDPADVSVVPGNHDAYVPGAFAKLCSAWAPWMTGEHSPQNGRMFPYMRVRGNIALIGVSSARATAPFMAGGYFRKAQAVELARLLKLAEEQSLFRVIMIHHPPLRRATPSHKRLIGISRFQKVVRECGADLVLHGHTHLPTLGHIDTATGRVPVIGVAAAGQATGGSRPAAQYNMLEINGSAGEWSLTLARYGLAPGLEEVTELVREEIRPAKT